MLQLFLFLAGHVRRRRGRGFSAHLGVRDTMREATRLGARPSRVHFPCLRRPVLTRAYLDDLTFKVTSANALGAWLCFE